MQHIVWQLWSRETVGTNVFEKEGEVVEPEEGRLAGVQKGKCKGRKKRNMYAILGEESGSWWYRDVEGVD